MSRRVLFVDEDQERNGSTVSMEYLVRGFHDRGYEVSVLTWKRDPRAIVGLSPWATILRAPQGPIPSTTMCLHFSWTKPPWSWQGVKEIIKDGVKFAAGFLIVVRAVRRERPDLVYVNEYSIVQASVAAAVLGVPSVMHIRSRMLRGGWGIRRRVISRLVLRFNSAVFAITRIEAEQLHPRPEERSKIIVVGEFVDGPSALAASAVDLREAFGITPGRTVITMLGGIKQIKGTVDVLRAAQEVVLSHPRIQVVIAGGDFRDGSAERRAYYKECIQVVSDLRARGSISMVGDIRNPMDLVAVSDIIVSPSPDTHFSRPVIEAWRLGKPVIAAATPHIKEFVTNEVNGLLVTPGDSSGLARAIVRLLDDPALGEKLGREGKKKAEADFDAGRNLQIIVDRCNACLQKAP